MRIAFTVTDIQDFFLFGHLLDLYIGREHEIWIYYDKTSNKITSVKKNFKILSHYNQCHLVPYVRGEDCVERLRHDEIDVVMTNEGMPFRKGMKLPCRLFAFSWTIEHTVHGSRFFPICDFFCCDDEIVNVLGGFRQYPDLSVSYDHPKYLVLDGKSKSEVCRMLKLSPKQKYVTVLGPAPALEYKSSSNQIKKLVNFFVEKNYKVVYKSKHKDKDRNICHRDSALVSVGHNFSTSVLLSYVSDFVIGFNTSAIVESIHTTTPFINFFLKHRTVNYKKHPQWKLNNDLTLRIEKFHRPDLDDFMKKCHGNKKRTLYPLAPELNL